MGRPTNAYKAKCAALAKARAVYQAQKQEKAKEEKQVEKAAKVETFMAKRAELASKGLCTTVSNIREVYGAIQAIFDLAKYRMPGTGPLEPIEHLASYALAHIKLAVPTYENTNLVHDEE